MNAIRSDCCKADCDIKRIIVNCGESKPFRVCTSCGRPCKAYIEVPVEAQTAQYAPTWVDDAMEQLRANTRRRREDVVLPLHPELIARAEAEGIIVDRMYYGMKVVEQQKLEVPDE